MSVEFQAAVQAVIEGDATRLRSLLSADASLVKQRSSSEHQATLLHYVTANGVEDELQVSPPNAVVIAGILLAAGAEVDAIADSDGGGSGTTPLALLVSSVHPHRAGVQTELVRVLVNAGARVDGLDDDGVPLATALAFMYPTAAETLIDCGARVDNVIFAAAAGRVDLLRRDVVGGMLRSDAPRCTVPWLKMSTDPREAAAQAFVYGCLCGRVEAAEYLRGEGVPIGSRAKPDFGRPTGLHLAAWGGHEEMVRVLLRWGADPTVVDDAFDGAPADWAGVAGYGELRELLVAAARQRLGQGADSADVPKEA